MDINGNMVCPHCGREFNANNPTNFQRHLMKCSHLKREATKRKEGPLLKYFKSKRAEPENPCILEILVHDEEMNVLSDAVNATPIETH